MHIYIHIPFCKQKCHYCAFNSFVTSSSIHGPYMESLLVQMKLLLEHYDVTKIESIFIGGGTPSVLSSYLYEPIFKTLSSKLSNHCEISVEANPTTANKNWLKQMRDFGVNRLSLGVQSFNNDKLKLLGRDHKSIDAKKTLENALEIGFENISIDLIYGTKIDTKELIKKDLQTAISFPLTHLSAYTLSIEKGTPFFKKKDMAQEGEKDAYMVKNILTKNNMPQYEVSNFGTKPCKHNLAYWMYKNYIGVGSGAVGFDGQKRYSGIKNIDKYIDNPTKLHIEEISQKEQLLEQLFLGLRSNVGILKKIIPNYANSRVETLLKENLIYENSGRYYAKDYFLADSLTLFIMG